MTWLWLFNGTNFIASGTNNWLELNDVQPSQSGTYSVVVTNLFGAATSSPARLDVLTAPPAIQSDPSSRTAEPTSDVSLAVKAIGSLPMTYQWRFNSTNAIVGATNRLLKMTQVQFSTREPTPPSSQTRLVQSPALPPCLT